MARCLLVDDDAEIRASLQAYLEGFGHRVATAADGAGMRRLLGAGGFDLVILDLMLPDENGLALCQWAQQAHHVPVIMLTAMGDPTSRIVGLEVGADDYLGKPFEPRELLARITAVLRRATRGRDAGPPRLARFGGFTLDRMTRQLTSPDEVLLPLSGAEVRLLLAFVDHPRRVLSRERLIELTRAPGVEVNDRSVDLTVSRLRQKLNDGARQPTLIVTVRGEGYRFDAEVES